MATQGSQIPDPLLSSEGATPFVPATPAERSTIAQAGTPHAIGNYRLLEEVARGGMGVVFKAQHFTTGVIVALKTIRLDRDASPEMVQRFEREIEAARQLKHPHVVPIHEVGHDGARAYFTMEFIAGGNLGRHRQRFQANCQAAVALMAKVARGVHHAHEQDILHRDLKPGNILLDAADSPLVSDFGLARFRAEETDLTRTGQVLGTPGYMAPEQALALRQCIGPRTDIWSLGVILYELLAGRKPYPSEDEAEFIEQIQNQQPPSLRSLKPDLDPALEEIVGRCLEKDPLDRYGSALDLATDLEHWLSGKPVPKRKLSWVRRARRGLSRHPRLTLAGLFAVAAAMLVLLFWQWPHPDRPLPYLAGKQAPGEEVNNKQNADMAHLHSLQKKLAAGQAIELIGEKGRPAWHQVKAGNMNQYEKFKVDPDGFFSIDSLDSICLVELMPDPQLERYRFRAWVRQNDNVEGGMVGLYANHVQLAKDDRRRNFYNVLGFTELTKGKTPDAEILLSFDLMHFGEDPAGKVGQVSRHALRRGRLPQESSGFGTWRELSIEVTSEHMSTFLNNELFEQVDHRLIDKKIDRMRQGAAKLELPRFLRRPGIGLFVYLGAASFKSVVVEPIP